MTTNIAVISIYIQKIQPIVLFFPFVTLREREREREREKERSKKMNYFESK
jgi:hypothetical protein